MIDVYTGDNKPDLLFGIEDKLKEADFTKVVSWRVVAARPNGTVVVSDTAPTVEVDTLNPAKVRVRHTWTALETAQTGRLYVECEATWPGGAKQTFQPIDNEVNIRASVG